MKRWHKDVHDRAAVMPTKAKEKKYAKKMMLRRCLTEETYEAVVFTTKSTIASIRDLLEVDDMVLLPSMTNDNVERCFNGWRQMMGGNFQGDSWEASCAFNNFLITSLVKASIDCNVGLTREKEIDYRLLIAQRTDKGRSNEILSSLPPIIGCIVNI